MKLKSILLLSVMLSVSLFSNARQTLPFNEGWSFKKGPFSANPIAFMTSWETKWEEVTIPHTWNAVDMQTKHNDFYEGEAYYKRSLYAKPEWKEKRVFLRFEGVGQHSEFYLNGQFVGNHFGGYSAFVFELTSDLNYGEDNELLLKVDNKARPDVLPVNHSLFGVYGGIYRPVSLIVTEKLNITVTDHASSGIYISQEKVSSQSASISVTTKLSNKHDKMQYVELETTIWNASGKKVRSNKENIKVSPLGIQMFKQELTIQRPRLWDGLADPYLYKVEICIRQEGKLVDQVIQPLGIRKIEVIAGEGVFLNEKQYPMYGVCRHQDWMGLGSALTNDHHKKDLELMREMGVTTIRLAHYQQSEYFYAQCDSMGFLVWAEIPFVNRVTTQEAGNAKSQMIELIRQNYNHPSIYTWGLHNEVYRPHSYTAALTEELHDLSKTEDPGRYTVAVNGYGHMNHSVNGNADIQGMNRYFGWYEGKISDMEEWAIRLEENYPDHKFMLAEYGAEANLDHQTEEIGNSIKWWGDFYPETYQTKTHEIHWGIIEKHPYILASYIWNMFDFCVPKWKRGGVDARNMKGLITFDRKVKKDAFFWYKAHWSKEPVLYITQKRLKYREKQQTQVTVYSNVGTPSLTLNGVALPVPKQGFTDKHFVFENVELKRGSNLLETKVDDFEDQTEWIFDTEKSRKSIEYENKSPHSGF